MAPRTETRKYSQRIVNWEGLPFLHCLWSHSEGWKVISTDIAENRVTVEDFGKSKSDAILYYEKISSKS